METMMAAGLILNPVGLIICILVPAITIMLARRPQLSAARLAAGYIGALFALAVAVACSSYVSPQDAVSVWHIAPEVYWQELFAQFVSIFAVAAFASIVGISVVGIPVLIALSNYGRATGPWLVLASVLISTAMAMFLYLLERSSSDIALPGTLGFLVISHAILTIGFSLAARLPWTFASEP
jgi:hypothetical protein